MPEAIGPHVDAALIAPVCHEIEVRLVVLIAEERLLPPVAALSDVVGDAGDDDSCKSGHAMKLPLSPASVKHFNAYGVPR